MENIFKIVMVVLVLVSVNMVKMQTIFLPYMQTKNGETFHEIFDKNPMLYLENK